VLANYSIDHVRPLWCRDFYRTLRDALPSFGCSALVYGNERGFSADVLVTDTARILGIPTVAELLNLYMHPDVVPTVVVAPSTYALEHESIRSAMEAAAAGAAGAAVVIPPSVDTDHFNPHRYRGKVTGRVNGQTKTTVVIGFVARLSAGL
jgi:hypothetical protein